MRQPSKDTTSAIADGVLRFIAGGGFLTTAVIAPNALQVFDKPLMSLLKKLDKRQRERELRRVLHYMKSKDLIRYDPRDYEHGIVLTEAGRQRLKRKDFAGLSIPRPRHWDHKWRLVFFDIPETERLKRNSFNLKLKQLGFQQLQISIWVHPFPCRVEIESVCEVLEIRKYATYVEISQIDNAPQLRKRFKQIIVH